MSFDFKIENSEKVDMEKSPIKRRNAKKVKKSNVNATMTEENEHFNMTFEDNDTTLNSLAKSIRPRYSLASSLNFNKMRKKYVETKNEVKIGNEANKNKSLTSRATFTRFSLPLFSSTMSLKGLEDFMDSDSEFGSSARPWSQRCDAQILIDMTEDEIKVQNLIYELYKTECMTVKTLKIMELYSLSFLNDVGMNPNTVMKIFPVLDDLVKFHSKFCKTLKSLRPKINDIVTNIGKTISEFFTGVNGDNVTAIYSTFCHKTGESIFLLKENIHLSKKFSTYLQKCLDNVIFNNRSVHDLHLLISQRITKYPIIVVDMIKHSKMDSLERTLLIEAQSNIQTVLQEINSNISIKKFQERKEEIISAFDNKSTVIFEQEEFSKFNISPLSLIFEMRVQLRLLTGKLIDVIFLIMEDLGIFLTYGPNHKYSFCSADGKCGVVALKDVITKEYAVKQNSFFLISKNVESPEMYEIHCFFRSEMHTLVSQINKCSEESKNNQSKSEDFRRKNNFLRSKRIQEYIATIFRIDQHIYDLLDERLYNHIDIQTFLYDDKSIVIPAEDADPFENYLYSCLHFERETALTACEVDQPNIQKSSDSIRKTLSSRLPITRSSTLDTCNAASKFKDSRPNRVRPNTCRVSYIPQSPSGSFSNSSIHVAEKPFEVLNKYDKVNFDKMFPKLIKHPAKPVFPILYELFSYNDSVLKSAISMESSFKTAKIQLDEANRSLEEYKSFEKSRTLNKLNEEEMQALIKDEALIEKERLIEQRETRLKNHVGILSTMMEYGAFNMESVPKTVAEAFKGMLDEYRAEPVNPKMPECSDEKQSIPLHLMSATNQRRLMLSHGVSNPGQQTTRLLQLSSKSKIVKDPQIRDIHRSQFRTSDLGDDVKSGDTVSERELYF